MKSFVLLVVLFALASVARAEKVCYTKPGTQSVGNGISNGSKEVADIPIGNVLPTYIAATTDGPLCYAAEETGNGVAVVDTVTNTLVAGIGGIPSPKKLAVGNGGSRLYPTANANDPVTGSAVVPQVGVVDITKHADGTRENSLLGFVNVRDVVPTANIAFAVATCTTSATPMEHVIVVGTQTGEVVQYNTLAFPPAPLGNRSFGRGVTDLRYATDCSKIYVGLSRPTTVTDQSGNLVSANLVVLDRLTLATVATLLLGDSVTGVSSSTPAKGRYMYVTTSRGFLYIIDTTGGAGVLPDTAKVAWQISASLGGIAEGERLVYVAIPTQNLIQIFRVSANGDLSLDGTIDLVIGSSPNDVAVLPPTQKGGRKP